MKLSVDENAKGLIFDLDGTLADSMPLHFKAWVLTARENGFEYTREQFLQSAGMPTFKIVEQMNRELGLKLDPEKFSLRKEELFLENIHNVKLIEPVAEIVRSQYKKLPMSIGTGGKKFIARKTLDIIGFSEYFKIIISAEDVVNHKPHPETFLKCAGLMKVEPEFCQVFEDGEMGLAAGRKAGMIVIDVRPFI